MITIVYLSLVNMADSRRFGILRVVVQMSSSRITLLSNVQKPAIVAITPPRPLGELLVIFTVISWEETPRSGPRVKKSQYLRTCRPRRLSRPLRQMKLRIRVLLTLLSTHMNVTACATAKWEK